MALYRVTHNERVIDVFWRLVQSGLATGTRNEDQHEHHGSRSIDVVTMGLVRSGLQRTAVRERGFVEAYQGVLGSCDVPFPIAVQKHGGIF